MECACVNTFPGVISAQKQVRANIPACVDPGTAAEGAASAYLDGAVGKGANVSPSTAPEAGYTCGPIVDWSENVKERAVKPAATSEGGACAEECRLGRAVGKRGNAGPGTAPAAGYASGFTVVRSVQVKGHAAESAAAAEGDARAGESTRGDAGVSAFSMRIRLVDISCPHHPPRQSDRSMPYKLFIFTGKQ